ncbi:brorin-like [Littorina saxatilis]|uniref:Pacifastin domain-containing protein n=1 Tax=Littorina saxatilis TaxID=31220 RepID=A0AAN9G930_9CAEN
MMKSVVALSMALAFLFVHVNSECIDADGNTKEAGEEPYLGPNGCMCFCSDDGPECSQDICPGYTGCEGPNGTMYEAGQGFAVDCNTCNCHGFGALSCTLVGCVTLDIKTLSEAP